MNLFLFKNIYKLSNVCLLCCMSLQALSQNGQSITGNFQTDAAYYFKDTAIGTEKVITKVFRANTFGNLNYINGNFSAGARFESYTPVLLGYPSYDGSGVPYKFARYKNDLIDITIGNFYDQFGSGMVFRAYEDRGLLFDNAVEGIKVAVMPYKGITLKGFQGRQRVLMGTTDGIIRGVDGEVVINDLLDSATSQKLKPKIILGGNLVSKYQEDANPTYILPKNVGIYSGRIKIIEEGLDFFAEYAQKSQDPSFQNNMSYNEGQGAFTSISYAKEGLSAMISGKYINNMSYRSDRNQSGMLAMVNYLPALSKPHTYMMAAYYPYASQPNGEIGGAAEFQIKLPKGSKLGGQYGSDITINASTFYAVDTIGLNPSGADSSKKLEYNVRYSDYGILPFNFKLPNIGKTMFHDINIEFTRKLSKQLKFTTLIGYQYLNQSIVQYATPSKGLYPDVSSFIGVIDVTYKYKPGSAIRFETQAFIGDYDYGTSKYIEVNNKFVLNTHNNTGNWYTALIEWTPNTHWFFVLADQFNTKKDFITDLISPNALHYYYTSAGYINGPTRITLSYGRQRAGIFCAGGVCRFVPAANAISLTISTSF